MDDPLKKLFEQTGWSYEDVLKRLEQYKQIDVKKTSTETNSKCCDNATISKTNNTEENKTSIESAVVLTVESVENNSNSRKRKISDETITSEEILPVCAKTEERQRDSDAKNDDEADCKKIRLSFPTDVTASNDSTVQTEKGSVDKLAGDHIEKYNEISCFEQIKEEYKKLEDCYQPNKFENIEYDKEDTTEHEQGVCGSNRLSDVDEIQEEPEANCENESNDNNSLSQRGIITKHSESRRNPDLKNYVVINGFCEEMIQEDTNDITYSISSSSSMEDLTKSLNKRRKLSYTDESNNFPSVSVLDDDSNKECDNIVNSTVEKTTKSPESSAREHTFTDQTASDEVDSNKENADLDNCKEQKKITKTQNALEENFNKNNSDISSISYSSTVRDDVFFDEGKSRYRDSVKLKNKEILSKCFFSENIKNAKDQKNSTNESMTKSSDGHSMPDSIETLKQEVCKGSFKMKNQKETPQKNQETQLVNDEDKDKANSLKDNVDQLDSNHCSNQKTGAVKSKPFNHGVKKLRNIINMISKKLENDGIENGSGKVQSPESSSSSSSNQDSNMDNQNLKNTRRKHQVLILKKGKSTTQIQSDLKTSTSDPASNSSSTISNKIATLATKKPRKFNTDRLNSITNILSQKLSNISKDLDSIEETTDDEPNFKIVDVVGGYKSPSPDVDYPKDWPYKNQHFVTNPSPNRIQTITYDVATTSKMNEAKSVTTEPVSTKIDYPSQGSSNKSTVRNTVIEKLSKMQTKTNETAIKPTKTKDVTKIKGWKKKKFAVESPVLPNYEKRSVSTVNIISPFPSMSEEASCSSTSQTHSAFTSDILDQYLTQNADLKISYEVPKLIAEQTLQQTYADIKFPKRQQEIVKKQNIPERKDKKPKTLAEKRKIEERCTSHVLEYLLKMEMPINKQYSTMLLKLKQKMLIRNVPFSRKSFVGSSRLTNTESFVMYNNKKIMVSSSKSNKALCKVVHKESVPHCKRPKKLSLLKSLSNEGVFYNPKEWETVEKQLPKVYLEFIPTIGKRLHPKISHLIESNETLLNRQRVNFALSVLKAPAPVPKPPKRFLFRIPFRNNQRNVLLRKRIIANTVDDQAVVKKLQIEETVDDAVNYVVNKMLDYVDVLDETKDILQEDDISDTVECEPVHPKKNQEEPTKVKLKEFKKTASEMRRLNCKFVSISTADENVIKKPCLKDHCRLGCVCASIEGSVSHFLESHCGLYKCMFQCTCKKDIPQYSSVFSEGIINRLQDEATKNLAKVEKEFTQTIIHTNNQLIVVGDSAERKRRVARAPKKYNDFVEDDVFHEEMTKTATVPTKIVTPTNLIYKNHIFEPCYVKLFNYNFKDIIPFCMDHLLYKCHCQKESTPSPPTRANEIPAPSPPVLFNTSPNRSKFNKNPFDKEEHTTRTRGISSSYYTVRNKTKVHLARIAKTSKILERQLNKYLKENEDEIMLNSESKNISKTTDDSGESLLKSASTTTITIEDANNLEVVDITKEKDSEVSASPPQYANVGKELKIQRRRMKQTVRDSGILQKSDTASEIHPSNVQQSEKEFCMFLARHNSQVRILPWSVLLSRYQSGSFQLWTLNAPNAPVLLTENGKRPTSFHCNVRDFEHLLRPFDSSCDIIRYIVNKQTPLGKSKDQVWVLFLETSKNIWRICGICDKNESKKDFSISIITLYGRLEDIIKKSEESMNVSDNIVTDGNKTITSVKRHYLPKMLVPDVVHKDHNIEETILWASIPNITSSCKWRVISLKIPFAHLSFSRCKYTIEFTDIVKAMKLARPNNLTLALRSADLHKTYPHRKFGIYCDCRFEDKIFVGPYFANENCDLSFLVLTKRNIGVNEGREVNRIGYWYRQVSSGGENPDDDVELIPDDTTLIDLTTDSDNEQAESNSAESEMNLLLKNEVSDLDSSKIDDVIDSKAKRYIITNVPAIGYISAAVHKNSNYLDIVCPITRKVKTFIHAPSAVETLQRILVRKFILVPHTFKLEVQMVGHINGTRYKPLKSSILNGYHMVGTFGVRNASTVTVQDLSKFGLTNGEVLQVLEQRERKLLLSPLTTLSKLLNVFIPNKAPFVSSVQKIAEAAQNEVDRLHNNETEHINQTVRLHNTKKKLTKQCLQIVANLSPEKRKQEQSRLRKILKSYTSRVEKIMNGTSVFFKEARNKTSNDDLTTSAEVKNLFDETVQKTSTELISSPSSTSASLPPIPNTAITTKPANTTSKSESEDKPVSKVTVSSSAINTSVPEINKNLKLVNNTVLKQKQGTSLLKSADKEVAPSPILHKYLNTSVLSKINILEPSTSTSTLTVKSPPHIKVAQKPASGLMVVTLPPTGAISTVKIGKSTYLAHNDQQDLTDKSPKNSDSVNNSMATLTPLTSSAPKKIASANIQNYIALKNGDQLRYYQLVSKQTKASMNQVVKTQQSDSVIKTSAKKIILSSALPINSDQNSAE